MKVKKKFSQVFLKDRNILDKIVTLANVCPDDIVCEIGCGQGWLSMRLAVRCQKLYISEIDPDCIAETDSTFDTYHITSRPEFKLGDFCKEGLRWIPADRVKVVANIPYHISTDILKTLIVDRRQLSTAIIMVQKEFAQKLLAKPGDKLYTSLSLFMSYYFDIQYGFTVSKRCFRPVPKVDSAVITLRPNPILPLGENPELLSTVIRSAFWGRRKSLATALIHSPTSLWTPDQIKQNAFINAAPKKRGETLSLDEFIALTQSLSV